MKNFVQFMLVLILLVVPFRANTQEVKAKDEKQKITKLDDLPRYTYDVTGTVTQMVIDDELFKAFADKVRTDIENVLNKYDIEDKTTLKRLYGMMSRFYMFDKDYDAVLKTIEYLRTLDEKPADKLTRGITTTARIKARKEAGEDEAAYRKAFTKYFGEAVNELPWNIVQDDIESLKGRMEILSNNVIIGIIQGRIEPAVKKTGNISGDVANQLIGMYYTMNISLPLKNEMVEVLQAYIDKNKIEKPDIWKERSVEFTGNEGYHPVVIGIWDSGVDAEVFKENMFINDKEKMDNKDDDGNGFIDDVHGIAFTLHEEKTSNLLYPMDPEEAKRLPEMKDQIKGLEDVQAAVESPEASALKKKMTGMSPQEVKPFIEEISLFGIYAHGTHVAGIAVEGNPYAKILVARLTFDHHVIPEPATKELAEKGAKNYQLTVDYFKAHHVRVVNMSWGWSLKEVESNLESNGIGKDAEERKKMAREIFDILSDGLYKAIKSAPEILFVNAAGNTDSDVSFDEILPGNFNLPNLLTVGAVDQAGDETSFTSTGETVKVHANGFEVESYIPGGERIAFSGTSMASPNVANLAGKLFAIDPGLSVSNVVELVKKGANTTKDGRRVLINPKRSIELLIGRKNQ